MSLYERIQHLIGRENRRCDECILQRLPPELYAEIFKSLDVESLKSCKEVCYAWANFLRQFGILREKSITTWNIATMDYGRKCKLIYRLVVGKIRILDTGFRLNGFLVDNFRHIISWWYTFEHVTHLEITNSHILILLPHLFRSMFKNVESMTLKDVYIEVMPGGMDKLNLKRIKISIKDKWESQLPGERVIVPTPQFASQYLTNQLEEYALEFFDSVLYKRNMHQIIVDELFDTFNTAALYASRTLQRNQKTIKSFSLKTFDLMDDRVNGLKQEHHEQPMAGHGFGFVNFLGYLENRISPRLDFAEIQLQRLTLTFRIIQIGLPIAQRVLIPLLRSQTALREVTLSQVYFPRDGAGVMHDLLTSLPTNCRTKLDGIMTLRQSPNNPNDGGIPDPPIRGYFDSTVELITQTVNLTLRFVFCPSLGNIDFFTRNIQFLKKIKIQQSGAHPVNKIVLTDQDVQIIITRAQQLTVLWLESCNLSAVTDSGLTGISAESCARMLFTRDFELRDGDIVGSPISAIKNLHSLNLSDVGEHVTDVTAHHGFNGLAGSLTSFGISTPKMTSNGLGQLRGLFQYNQIVKFDVRRKLGYTLPGEEIAAPQNPR